jgi:hypothetical protein
MQVNSSRFLRAVWLAALGFSSYFSIRLAWTTSADPENPDVLMQLGQSAELAGDLALAEHSLLRAADLSRLYQPRYLLTQFYFRHPQGDRFWTWSRRAFESAYGDVAPLINLAWRTHPDGEWLWRNAIPNHPAIARQYLGFLMGKQQWEPAAAVARHLAVHATIADRQALLIWSDARLAAGDIRAPRDIWNELCRRRLLPYDPDALITNSGFSVTPLAAGFDWRPTDTPGVTVSIDRGRLQIAFTGRQPEQCILIWQYIQPPFRLDRESLGDGLAWTIEGARLALIYRRPSGSPRRADTIAVAAPRITRVE